MATTSCLVQTLEQLQTLAVMHVQGLMTNQCVEAAVRSAADLGYHTIVPSDGCVTNSVSTWWTTSTSTML